jgi:hypothetical protein
MYMTKTFKLLNCHPKKTRKKNTCYDDNTLLLLKKDNFKDIIFLLMDNQMDNQIKRILINLDRKEKKLIIRKVIKNLYTKN